jgi:hypothetical protein
MPQVPFEELEPLIPLAAAWVEQQEARILREGAPLTTPQTADARAAGVVHPRRVRLLCVDTVPRPQHPELALAAERASMLTPDTTGLTMRYGIFITADMWGDRELVAHELVHVHQYERFGSIAEFLRRYLSQCLTVGYLSAPLEREAIDRSRELVRARP